MRSKFVLMLKNVSILNLRVYVTWLILHMLPPSQLSIGFPLLLFAWTVTEMIRYSMYAINLVSTPPYILTWLR